MNTQRILRIGRMLFTGAVVALLAAAGRAQISLSYVGNESSIQVGGLFSVDINATFSDEFLLTSFVFDAAPSFGKVSLIDVEYPSWIEFGDPSSVDGFSLFGERGVSPGALTIATLNFQADAEGLETVNLFGDTGLGAGLFYLDDAFDAQELSVNSSFNVSVSAVPEPSTYVMIGIAVLGLGIARRRRNTLQAT